MMPDPNAIGQIAEKLLKADYPLLLPEYAGRREGGFENMVTLAETIGAGVWDICNALNFPNKHPLCVSLDKPALKGVDVVLGLDVKDFEKATYELDSTTRKVTPIVDADAEWLEMGFAEEIGRAHV